VLAKTEDITQEVRAEEDNYVAALEWADTLGVDISSASLAYFSFDDSTGYTPDDLDGDTAVITVAIDIAASKGITCVNAMGNSGPGAGTLWTPADADTMLAVGAVDAAGAVADFSSRGPTADARVKPEISARGVSTYWAQAWTLGYGNANGTSLSTPLIGGLAALLKEAHPGWTPHEVRAAVIGTGSEAGSPNNDVGYGIARGLDALTFGGGTPQPPRMTLPFCLLEPAHDETLTTVIPTLAWSTSAAANGGDEAQYRVIYAEDQVFSAPDTVFVGTDTTFTLGLPPGVTRWWKVEAVGNQGFTRKAMNTHSFTVDQALAIDPELPIGPAVLLAPAFPNPMGRETTFAFRVPAGEEATLEIVDVSGRLVRRFAVTGTGGPASLGWDGRDDAGRETPAGVYFYRLVTRGESFSRRLVRLP
jgi:hypothetical protein